MIGNRVLLKEGLKEKTHHSDARSSRIIYTIGATDNAGSLDNTDKIETTYATDNSGALEVTTRKKTAYATHNTGALEKTANNTDLTNTNKNTDAPNRVSSIFKTEKNNYTAELSLIVLRFVRPPSLLIPEVSFFPI